MVAEHRIQVIIKGGDFNAFTKDRVVDFSPVLNVSTSMVIFWVLFASRFEGICEDLFENARGFGLSSLSARKRSDMFS